MFLFANLELLLLHLQVFFLLILFRINFFFFCLIEQKSKFVRTKEHVNVGTIGHVDHGKKNITNSQFLIFLLLKRKNYINCFYY